MSNFQPLEVVDRSSATQLQVAENLYKLGNILLFRVVTLAHAF